MQWDDTHFVVNEKKISREAWWGGGVEGQVNARAPKDHLLLAASQFGKKFATYVFFFVGNETHCTGKQLPREGSTIP